MRPGNRFGRPWRWLLLVGAITMLAVALGGGALSNASTAGNVVYLPAVFRSSFQPTASFAIALPGDGIVVTRSGVTVTSVVQMAVAPVLPDAINLQSAGLTFDGGLDLLLTVKGDITKTSDISDTIIFDWIGRPTDVQRTPFISFVQSCQQSPTSDPKVYVANGSGFPPNSQVWLRSQQIGGEEQFPFPKPVATSASGDWTSSFRQWSDNTKWWELQGFNIPGGQTPLATAGFKTLVGEDCPPASVVEPPPSPLADATMPFATNATFDVRIERTNGTWGVVLYRWTGRGWLNTATGSLSRVSVEGSTVRARVAPADLGVSGKCVTWGALSQRYAPGSNQGVGKAALIDQTRGPLATFCWNPDETGAIGGPAVEAWVGCDGGSYAGLLPPPCGTSVQSQGSDVSASTSHQPAILGQVIGGAAIPPRTCTRDEDCPPVGMEIWLHADGTAAFGPGGPYGPFRFRVSSLSTPNQSVEVSIQQEDYDRVWALRHINTFMPTAAYQKLLAEYQSGLTPALGTSFDAAGIAIYPPPPEGNYNTAFVKLDQRLRWQPIIFWEPNVERMIWFSQVPMTFRTSQGSTKFIISTGSGNQ